MSTDRDWADKSWLREKPDAFQLIPPASAADLFIGFLSVLLIIVAVWS